MGSNPPHPTVTLNKMFGMRYEDFEFSDILDSAEALLEEAVEDTVEARREIIQAASNPDTVSQFSQRNRIREKIEGYETESIETPLELNQAMLRGEEVARTELDTVRLYRNAVRKMLSPIEDVDGAELWSQLEEVQSKIPGLLVRANSALYDDRSELLDKTGLEVHEAKQSVYADSEVPSYPLLASSASLVTELENRKNAVKESVLSSKGFSKGVDSSSVRPELDVFTPSSWDPVAEPVESGQDLHTALEKGQVERDPKVQPEHELHFLHYTESFSDYLEEFTEFKSGESHGVHVPAMVDYHDIVDTPDGLEPFFVHEFKKVGSAESKRYLGRDYLAVTDDRDLEALRQVGKYLDAVPGLEAGILTFFDDNGGKQEIVVEQYDMSEEFPPSHRVYLRSEYEFGV